MHTKHLPLPFSLRNSTYVRVKSFENPRLVAYRWNAVETQYSHLCVKHVVPFWPRSARKTDICQNDSGTSNENRAQATAQSSKLDFKAEPAWPSNPTLCAAIANGKICQITVSCVCRPDARRSTRVDESCDGTCLHSLRETRREPRTRPSTWRGKRIRRVAFATSVVRIGGERSV